MAIRKLTKVGNSLGIMLPVEMLKTANFAFGDELEVEFKGVKIILRKNKNVKLPKGVDAEFMEMLSDFIKKREECRAFLPFLYKISRAELRKVDKSSF
ncbi:AbrB/MazE/SpoVT family DNA-binding domain-containing protein [Peribacillus frigoritolerans]|uniref:AbrB/MazE/SpoVT family DNA-binding domain-containing protein n=1 Tax=Peribacillus frigoritolerans TaxID=450367 RepID=UPI00345CB8B7